ncbi:type II toxin-antitoxin system RelE/ParE family toxin [Cronobacter sakazakii]|uniref:type II toxin-antitoxin system RelE/ParE family toxin n=1 Tax=Cronobacter sakazakii TaxID=28141 RepID=UPI00131A02B1|nr:type II toxin-antitoxin system RelE/ParE family toxin [Cronobacter sakazakii]ELY4344843.1 type II toxin-antitoxin system RelE/ParE family toxin [Cronobacter sakazakii]ELY4758665.1 type II toxin-antitoxin system RelE/ParE family toxin [Cronobacter sakazakii]ELY6297689.1 type II toxin-antitoxin system RelE/ParE family toxin [Cronobacter sakazakii]ELY6340067.1 type II toxin-antitoxin system RelE/ParE family toxin [Cronobacter sakazakii]
MSASPLRRAFLWPQHSDADSENQPGCPLRRFPCASHIIYYTAPDSGIIVLAVLHHSRLPAGELSARRV